SDIYPNFLAYCRPNAQLESNLFHAIRPEICGRFRAKYPAGSPIRLALTPNEPRSSMGLLCGAAGGSYSVDGIWRAFAARRLP
ncbi:MAG: hypothetical protein J0I57_10990, partial [Hyphomicrobium sp.]|nr:hypothetical protein [Hyphomicrobium sp.]